MAMVSEALLQPHEEQEAPVENDSQETGIRIKFDQFLHNLQVQKSIEILQSAITISFITSNTKLMFLMILATVPSFVFMFIYEFNVHKLLDAASNFLEQSSTIYYYYYDFDSVYENYHSRKPFRNLVQLVPFHLVLSPLIEFFGFTVIVNIASQVYAGEKESSSPLYEFFYEKNKLKGPLVTCVLVQLLSTSTLVGLFWTLANHYVVTSGVYYYYFPGDSHINMLSIGFHALLFVAVLYKYLDWSATWNMAIVISVLEEETGIDALEVSALFGKHSRTSGLQVMLVYFVYSVGARLPLLAADHVSVVVIVLALLCLGSLVKWVALVLYYYECKSEIMLKKGDEELGRAVKAAGVV